MKTKDNRTTLQLIADWMAIDGGNRDTRFEITYSDKAMVIMRKNEN